MNNKVADDVRAAVVYLNRALRAAGDNQLAVTFAASTRENHRPNGVNYIEVHDVKITQEV